MSRAVDVLPSLCQCTFESFLVTGEIGSIERNGLEQIRMMVEVCDHTARIGLGDNGTMVELDQAFPDCVIEQSTELDLLVIDTCFLLLGLVMSVPSDRVSEVHIQLLICMVFIRIPQKKHQSTYVVNWCCNQGAIRKKCTEAILMVSSVPLL